VQHAVARWRAEPALGLTDELGEISRFIPFEIVAAAATASDVTASNVPGPPIPVYLAGARVEQMVPLPPPIGAAVFVALLSYSGTATIGVAMDDAAVADRELLMECMRHGFARVSGGAVPAWDPLQPHSAAKKAPAKKSTAKKASAKKASAKKAPAKKAPVKKSAAKKSAAKKTTAKGTAAKRTGPRN